MVLAMEPRPIVQTEIIRVKVRCSSVRSDGRLCGHVVATIAVDEWEQQRELSTTLECKRCGHIEMLSTFM